MKKATVDTLIYKYTHKFTLKNIKEARTVTLVLCLMLICVLAVSKFYVIMAILILFAIEVYLRLTSIIRSNALTVYDGVRIGLILLGTFVVCSNVMLFIVQMNVDYRGVLLLSVVVVVFIETLCLISGFFYTLYKVEKGGIRKDKNSVTRSAIYYISGGLSYFLAKIVAAKTSIDFKNLFFTAIFAIVGCALMFYIGLSYLSMIYCIKKYKIANRLIEKR